jgi:hypothetical protein
VIPSTPTAIAHVRSIPACSPRRSLLRSAAAVVALATLAALAPTGGALEAQGYFGKNHVQYDDFDWRVLETEHFLIYYYPAERAATLDAARMAERTYARLSRILDHQFREKKPIVLFASRSDFGQNNVLGDLGETTGGATDALRHRMLLNFTGDYVSFERVLAHEMVHTFQFDVFAHGRAGRGMQVLSRTDMPQWFSDGMAEYLSLGPASTLTDMWMRDAALNGKLPSIRELSQRPDRYFPYRYGHALWTYVGQRWGDDVIGQLMHAIPGVGVERAFKRELGVSLEELGDEWRESMQTQYLPGVGQMERVRQFAQPVMTSRRTGGEFFLSPTLSPDGTHLAFLSTGSVARGEVFIDLCHRSLARQHRDGQAPQAAGEEHHRSGFRGAAHPVLAERLLAGRALPGVHRAAPREGRALPAGRGHRGDRTSLRPAGGRRDGAELLPRRQAARLQRHLRRALGSLRRGRHRREPRAADARPVRRPPAAVVTRRDADRLRHGPRSRGRSREAPPSALAYRAARALDRQRARDRGPGGAEPEPAVGAGRPVARLRLRPGRHAEPAPVRPGGARASPDHEGRRGHRRRDGVQPRDLVGARRRPHGDHALRRRQVLDLDGAEPAAAPPLATARRAGDGGRERGQRRLRGFARRRGATPATTSTPGHRMPRRRTPRRSRRGRRGAGRSTAAG